MNQEDKEDKCASAAQELCERVMTEMMTGMKKKAVDVGAVISEAFERNVEATRKIIAEQFGIKEK